MSRETENILEVYTCDKCGARSGVTDEDIPAGYIELESFKIRERVRRYPRNKSGDYIEYGSIRGEGDYENIHFCSRDCLKKFIRLIIDDGKVLL